MMYGEVSTKYSNYETTQSIYEDEIFDKMPGELIWEDEHYVVSPNVLSSYNGFLFKGRGDLGIFNQGEEQCWQSPIVDACGPSPYIKGLGGPFHHKLRTTKQAIHSESISIYSLLLARLN